jgi:hypothetical protein
MNLGEVERPSSDHQLAHMELAGQSRSVFTQVLAIVPGSPKGGARHQNFGRHLIAENFGWVRTRNGTLFSKAVVRQALEGRILLRDAGRLLGIKPSKLNALAKELEGV